MYIVYINELGNVEYYRMDLVNNTQATYLARHANSIVTDTLPDEEYSDCFEISDNEVVIGSKAITRRQNEINAEINADVAVKKYANITVNSKEFDVNANTITNLMAATAPVDWVLSDNTTTELSAQDLSDVIAAISARTTALVTDGRRKKDLVLAMTTLAELETLDIQVL